MTAPTPPVPVTLNLGFAPDDGMGAGVRPIFQALLSALSARDAYAGALAQQIADLQTQLAGITTLTPARKVATGAGLAGGGDLSQDRTVAIAPNGVTNDLLAKVPTLTLKANLLGSTASAQDASLPALLDAVFGGTQGGLLYRSATGWAPLPLGVNGTVLQSNGQDVVFGPAAAGSLLAANNLSDVASAATARTSLGLAVLPLGQCRLVYSSATGLLLKTYQGNQLWVNGAYRTIPSGGVSLTSAGLTSATLYYVYAYMSGSTLTLEAVTTGHSADATFGHEIKTGDGTRTLVGMVYTGPGTPGTFLDTAANRWVASWFNRRERDLY
ncbi:hypothetical protein MKL20_17750, partial [Methylobacterium sp. E-066]|nr:hypothetical protein [Methylobacterium sp. E-066]